ncbi:MAG TPA: hypothetical protein VLB82_06140 [Thermodesulfobacteriota bacterium]|nr:hypothetical protein [Thermodesulfobacteriota bacterium]
MANFIDKQEIDLPKYIKSELKFIEKGIVSHKIEGKIYFIFKNNAKSRVNLDDIEEISVEFDPILRDEFPSVRMIIHFSDNYDELFNMDYYFSIESDKELEHLYDLYGSKIIQIIYYDKETSVCCNYSLNMDELKTISNTIEQIES